MTVDSTPCKAVTNAAAQFKRDKNQKEKDLSYQFDTITMSINDF